MVAPDAHFFFQSKVPKFLLLHEKICYWYLLEVPRGKILYGSGLCFSHTAKYSSCQEIIEDEFHYIVMVEYLIILGLFSPSLHTNMGNCLNFLIEAIQRNAHNIAFLWRNLSKIIPELT